LQKSDLIVIAADTSQGKTSLAVTVALRAAQHGSAIAMYSMEMKKEQIAARMMSIESGVPANTILFSRLTDEQFDSIDRGLARLYDKPVYFDDRSTSNIDTIIASIRSLIA
jgi:replicative DNA helicase